MDESDHLLVRLNEILIYSVLRSFRCRRSTNVIHALEDHRVPDARVGEHVAVDAAECIGAQTISKNAITACCKVAEGDVLGRATLLEACEKEVGPAVVLVCCGAAAVGDGVTHNQQAANGLGGPGLDAREEVPMRCTLRGRVCNSDVCGVDSIAKLPPAVRPAAGMTGD